MWVIAPLLELLEVLLDRRGLKGGLSMEKKREPFKRKTHTVRGTCVWMLSHAVVSDSL